MKADENGVEQSIPLYLTELLTVAWWDLPHHGAAPTDEDPWTLAYMLTGTPVTEQRFDTITVAWVNFLWFDLEHMHKVYARFKFQFEKGDPRIEGWAGDPDPFEALPFIDVDIRGKLTRLYAFEAGWAINLGPGTKN